MKESVISNMLWVASERGTRLVVLTARLVIPKRAKNMLS